MKIEGDLCWARFIGRKSRFSIRAEIDLSGRPVEVFMANPGRLKETLVPGRKLLLKKVKETGTRKTEFDMVGACVDGRLVTLDTRFANTLVREAIEMGNLAEFQGCRYVRSEPVYGSGRFDLLLVPPCLIEVKSCTVVREGVALFPDAPTARGRRHLMELKDALREGYRACIIFVVQRDDARILAPHWDVDPEFSAALRDTEASGVEVLAYAAGYECEGRDLAIRRRIPVDLRRRKGDEGQGS